MIRKFCDAVAKGSPSHMRLWCCDSVGWQRGRKICFFEGVVETGGFRQSLFKKVTSAKFCFLFWVKLYQGIVYLMLWTQTHFWCCFYGLSRSQNYVKSQYLVQSRIKFYARNQLLDRLKNNSFFRYFRSFLEHLTPVFKILQAYNFPLLVIWMTAVDLSCCWTCLRWIAFRLSSLTRNIRACLKLKHL